MQVQTKLCYHYQAYFLKVSEAPKEAPAAKKFTSFDPQFKTDLQKKEEVITVTFVSIGRHRFDYCQLMSAMIDKMGDKDDDPLPQETMDGVDSDEWSDQM